MPMRWQGWRQPTRCFRPAAPIRFVPPPADGLGYEARIAMHGEGRNPPDNWHDWFNALVWLGFPRPKAALSARHAAELAAASPLAAPDCARGRVRDAMTHSTNAAPSGRRRCLAA